MKKQKNTTSNTGTAAKYREVKCPYCDHVYMWMVCSGDGIHYEKDGMQGQWIGRRSKCPKCASTFAVMDGVFTGVLEEDLGEGIVLVRECSI